MKIIQVINKMIENRDKISNVLKSGNEYFFLYNNKHKWSIIKNDMNNYFLFIYPDAEKNLDDIIQESTFGNNPDSYISYSTLDLDETESVESFKELYQIVSGKIYGVDDLFDEIINS